MGSVKELQSERSPGSGKRRRLEGQGNECDARLRAQRDSSSSSSRSRRSRSVESSPGDTCRRRRHACERTPMTESSSTLCQGPPTSVDFPDPTSPPSSSSSSSSFSTEYVRTKELKLVMVRRRPRRPRHVLSVRSPLSYNSTRSGHDFCYFTRYPSLPVSPTFHRRSIPCPRGSEENQRHHNYISY
ncbi:hypothetical protein Mp_2g08220 [Marchantia polymorpha subsp. ruderalis]|uniref:Uncharacterized protein n=1 Tax=Marchantia polymorpha TaxID=3197 RepID=A0A2R6XGW9_MARPO|nr:hypothetical protein MARPO_0015s0107 [Marchantia polymorpha]BBN01540.1 hypothetical protein Mp_2g08220 [Marchantia polymorpha subsp. ruderalis]|eukprot:PTQ45309.1 hypothetical protein MARPO_0015s0107 [Marchantia polymorpha]